MHEISMPYTETFGRLGLNSDLRHFIITERKEGLMMLPNTLCYVSKTEMSEGQRWIFFSPSLEVMLKARIGHSKDKLRF